MKVKMTEEEFLSLFADDLDIALTASHSFLKTYSLLKKNLDDSIKKEESDSIKKSAHALKGAVSVFSLDSYLPDKIKNIESFALAGKLDMAKKEYDSVETTLNELFKEIMEFVKKKDTHLL